MSDWKKRKNSVSAFTTTTTTINLTPTKVITTTRKCDKENNPNHPIKVRNRESYITIPKSSKLTTI